MDKIIDINRIQNLKHVVYYDGKNGSQSGYKICLFSLYRDPKDYDKCLYVDIQGNKINC